MINLAITAVLFAIFGLIAGFFGAKSILKNSNVFENRFRSYYHLLNKWLKVKIEGRQIIDYLETNNINALAIYGFGELGMRLYEELTKTRVDVAFIVNKSVTSGCQFEGIKVVDIPDVSLQGRVDAIIVTPVYDFQYIFNDLIKAGVKDRIISLEEIITKLDD